MIVLNIINDSYCHCIIVNECYLFPDMIYICYHKLANHHIIAHVAEGRGLLPKNKQMDIIIPCILLFNNMLLILKNNLWYIHATRFVWYLELSENTIFYTYYWPRGALTWVNVIVLHFYGGKWIPWPKFSYFSCITH